MTTMKRFDLIARISEIDLTSPLEIPTMEPIPTGFVELGVASENLRKYAILKYKLGKTIESMFRDLTAKCVEHVRRHDNDIKTNEECASLQREVRAFMDLRNQAENIDRAFWLAMYVEFPELCSEVGRDAYMVEGWKVGYTLSNAERETRRIISELASIDELISIIAPLSGGDSRGDRRHPHFESE